MIILPLSCICDMTLNKRELEYINYNIHFCTFLYKGVKDFLTGNNGYFFVKAKWVEINIFISPVQMIAVIVRL